MMQKPNTREAEQIDQLLITQIGAVSAAAGKVFDGRVLWLVAVLACSAPQVASYETSLEGILQGNLKVNPKPT